MPPVDRRMENPSNGRPSQAEANDAVASRIPRPPNPAEVHTEGENDTFRGTNPWSGPYLVFAVLAVVAMIAVVFLFTSLAK